MKLSITTIIITSLIIISLVMFVAVLYSFEEQFVAKNDNAAENWFLNSKIDNYERLIVVDINKSILVGIYNAGYLYHEEHDHGINKDVIEEFFTRLGLGYKIEIMPRARISSMLAEGSLPVGVSTVATAERSKFSYFVPYFSQKNDVLIRKNANISTEKELFERDDLKVGIVRGYYYGEHYTYLIDKLKERHMIVEAKDIEQLYQMFRDDWIQVTFNISTSYLYYFDYYKIEDVDIYDWAPHEKPLVRNLAFSKKYFTPEDIDLFQRTIQDMKNDGTLYRIFNRYLLEDDIEGTCEF